MNSDEYTIYYVIINKKAKAWQYKSKYQRQKETYVVFLVLRQNMEIPKELNLIVCVVFLFWTYSNFVI